MATQRPQFPPEVLEALKQGNKIEAIKLLRQSTKLGLAEAKAAVDMLDKMKGMVGAAQAIANVAQGVRPSQAQPLPAKAARPVSMQSAPAQAPPRRPGMSPGEVPRDTSGAVGIAILVLVGLVVAFSLVR